MKVGGPGLKSTVLKLHIFLSVQTGKTRGKCTAVKFSPFLNPFSVGPMIVENIHEFRIFAQDILDKVLWCHSDLFLAT